MGESFPPSRDRSFPPCNPCVRRPPLLNELTNRIKIIFLLTIFIFLHFIYIFHLRYKMFQFFPLLFLYVCFTIHFVQGLTPPGNIHSLSARHRQSGGGHLFSLFSCGIRRNYPSFESSNATGKAVERTVITAVYLRFVRYIDNSSVNRI